MQPPVFLIHGFRSDSASFNDFAKVLKPDYQPILVELPLSFDSLKTGLVRLKKIVLDYVEENKSNELYFIGHSTGGIIIRMLMKDVFIASITKVCLFVATPNNGTILANFHQSLPSIIKEIHLPLKELTKEAIYNLMLLKPQNVVYGAIAGSQPLKMTDFFFNSSNDGLVSVKSVFMKELNDFIVLPYNHFEIHHYLSTCVFGKYFIKNQKFPSGVKDMYKMEINEKFVVIVENGYINELCAQLKRNIDFATAGGKVWWKEIGSCNGWRLQQNKLSHHLRIINPDNIRKAWGVSQTINDAINLVYERIKCNEIAGLHVSEQSRSDVNNIADKIRQLKQLFDEGLIDELDFESRKKELLERI